MSARLALAAALALAGCAEPHSFGGIRLDGEPLALPLHDTWELDGGWRARPTVGDCGACDECGDFLCDDGETAASCPGDCGG